MNKFYAVKSLRENGDSILCLQGDEEDIAVTTDFSARYIRRKRYSKFSIQKGSLLVFSWTDDKFRNIELTKVKKIIPLSRILGNK